MRSAVDFVPKPAGDATIKNIIGELAAKVKVAAGISLATPAVYPGAKEPSRTERLGARPLRKGDAVDVLLSPQETRSSATIKGFGTSNYPPKEGSHFQVWRMTRSQFW